ncbi:MAG: DUF4956 domain-containing protein [Planctomycetaceae bacterium]|nr:DUF4956 domain-containing protein [Planctomycetaceae bacterium]
MEFLEVPLFDDDIYKLLVRFVFNLVFLSLIVRLAIYPNQREREFAFTAVMLNVIVFFICFTMKKLELDLGLALGLFAIFGVLRYRTDALRPKEMTYLFIVIGIAVINSLSNKKTSYAEITLVNSLIVAATILKEWGVGRVPAKGSKNGSRSFGKTEVKTDGKAETKSTSKSQTNAATESAVEPGAAGTDEKSASRESVPKEEVSRRGNGGKKRAKFTVEYDQLNLLGDEHRDALLQDLKKRTGLNIECVEIKNIDLLQNRVTLTIWPVVS